MSVSKLLSRIVAPTELLEQHKGSSGKDLVSTLHDHTYGINSDPLTQFASLLAALIHDVRVMRRTDPFALREPGLTASALFR
jgi:hypothetical protein